MLQNLRNVYLVFIIFLITKVKKLRFSHFIKVFCFTAVCWTLVVPLYAFGRKRHFLL